MSPHMTIEGILWTAEVRTMTPLVYTKGTIKYVYDPQKDKWAKVIGKRHMAKLKGKWQNRTEEKMRRRESREI